MNDERHLSLIKEKAIDCREHEYNTAFENELRMENHEIVTFRRIR